MSDKTKKPTVPPVSPHVRHHESGIGRNPGKPFMVTAKTRLKIDASGPAPTLFGFPVVVVGSIEPIDLEVGSASRRTPLEITAVNGRFAAKAGDKS